MAEGGQAAGLGHAGPAQTERLGGRRGGVLTQEVPEGLDIDGAVDDGVGEETRQYVEVRLGLAGAGQVADRFEVQGHG